MTANKLQEAITLIRSGDKQGGQKLLTEVLNAEPGNETAWLWMSALMSGEKRRFCLEKVLSINPHHQQAREQLAKLASTAPAPELTIPTTVSTRVLANRVPPLPAETKPAPEPQPEPVPVAAYASVQGAPLPKVWLIPGKYLSSFLYLEGNNLLTFDAAPEKASQVLEEVRAGVTQNQFGEIKDKFNLMSVNHVLLNKIRTVTLFGESLTVVAEDRSGSEKKVNVTINKENSEAILNTLHERLGPDFQRANRPISRMTVMGSALILFLLTCCGSGSLSWFTQGLKADLAGDGMVGSARARGIANLLLLIGPNGFLCIGGVLTVIVIIFTIASLRKPPEETVLARGTGSRKSS
jgi:hypothetical protein